MTHPPLDEPWQEPRAVRYGRANQATNHYRPRAGHGRVTPSRSQAIPKPSRKSTNHRRFWLFAIALLAALAAGAAMFTAVLAGPKPMAQAPDTPTPAPSLTSDPTVPPSETGPDRGPDRGSDRGSDAGSGTGDELRVGDPSTSTENDSKTGGTPPTRTQPPVPPQTTTPPLSGDGGGSTSPPASNYAYYKNCGQARKAGAAPLHEGDPGYSTELDKDDDGVACEPGKD